MAIKDNWIMWLGFDDGGIVGKDYSGNGNNASAFGGTPAGFNATGGKPNGFVTLGAGGLNTGFLLADNPSLSFVGFSPFTFHCWLKPLIVSGVQRYIFYKRTDSSRLEYQFVINTNGSVAVTCWRASGNNMNYTSPAGTLVPGTWAHLVLVWDNITSHFLFYKNGLLVADVAPTINGVYTPGMVNTTSDLGILANVGGGEYYEGDADNVAIRNSITTAEEVTALYNGTYGLNPFTIKGGGMLSFF